jgi:hypothetical protein
MSARPPKPEAAPNDGAMTRREMEALADRQAFRKLDAGELRGTAAEAEFRGLRWILEE